MKTLLHNWHIDRLVDPHAGLSLSGTSLENCLDNLGTGSDLLLGITEDRFKQCFLCEDINGVEFMLPWGSMLLQDFRSDERAHEFYTSVTKRFHLASDAFEPCISAYFSKLEMYQNEAEMLLKPGEAYIAIDEYDMVYAATRSRSGQFSRLFVNRYADDKLEFPLSITKHAANNPPEDGTYGGITVLRCSLSSMLLGDESFSTDTPNMPCYGLSNWMSRLKVVHIRANCCDDFILSHVSGESGKPSICLNLPYSSSSLVSLRRSDYFGG